MQVASAIRLGSLDAGHLASPEFSHGERPDRAPQQLASFGTDWRLKCKGPQPRGAQARAELGYSYTARL